MRGLRVLSGFESRQNSLETETETETESSEEDLQTSRSRKRPGGLRYAFATTFLIAVIVACFVNLSPKAKLSQPLPAGTFGAKTVGLFETEEFTSLMTTEVRRCMERMGVEDDRAQDHVVAATTSTTNYIAKHVSEPEAFSLKNVRLDPEGWETVRTLLTALSDERVQNVGHAMVQEARANLLGGPAEIGKAVAARLQRENLQVLSQEVLPAKLRSTLMRRWDSANASENDIWKMMLDPTGDNLARIRSNSTSRSIEGTALPERRLGLRSLRDGPWAKNFKLSMAEVSLGISALVFTSVAEVLLHVDLLVPHLKVPWWAHTMLIVPAVGTGTVTCITGLSFWCEFFLGALGLNALDVIAILGGLDLIVDRDRSQGVQVD